MSPDVHSKRLFLLSRRGLQVCGSVSMLPSVASCLWMRSTLCSLQCCLQLCSPAVHCLHCCYCDLSDVQTRNTTSPVKGQKEKKSPCYRQAFAGNPWPWSDMCCTLHNVLKPVFGPCGKCPGHNEHLDLLGGRGAGRGSREERPHGTR